MPWVNYGKKKKLGQAPTWEYCSESVPIDKIDEYRQSKRAGNWLIKGYYWAGIPGEMFVMSERSSQYIPKVKKTRTPKAKPTVDAEVVAE